jgi:hypothetical protein
VPDQERAFAEHLITADVTEILEEDPADEADIQPSEQQYVASLQRAAGGVDADEIGHGDITGGQHQGGEHAAGGHPHWAQ